MGIIPKREVDEIIIEGDFANVDGRIYRVHGMVIVMAPYDEPDRLSAVCTIENINELVCAARVIGEHIAESDTPEGRQILTEYNRRRAAANLTTKPTGDVC